MTTNSPPPSLAAGSSFARGTRHARTIRAVLATVYVALQLSGCGSVTRTLGLEKAPPDEFAVVANAPLSQPPDYTLRPPTPGAPRPQEGSTTDRARSALSGVGAVAPAAPSQGEQAVLSKAGSNLIVPDIRHKVDEETTGLVQTSQSFTDSLLFWKDTPVPGEPVDAISESKRLKENAIAGKPPTEGESVFISRTPAPSESHWYSWFF
jgi:hypothetical protein